MTRRLRSPIPSLALAAIAFVGCQNAKPEPGSPAPTATSPAAEGPGELDTLGPQCAAMTRAVCGVARAACDKVTEEFARIGLPEAVCREALSHVDVLAKVPSNEGGAAAAKLLRLTSENTPGMSEDQHARLDRFATSLEQQWLHIAEDGSDDRLPEGDGLTFHLAWPVMVRVTANEVRVGGEPPIRLTDGAFADGTTSDGMVPALIPVLNALAISHQQPDDHAPIESLVFHADRAVPWGTLLSLMRSARGAGYHNYGFAVRDKRTLRQTTFEPFRGSADDGESPAWGRAIEVRLLERGYWIGGQVVRDLAGLAAEAKRIRAADPILHKAVIRAPATIPVQAVLSAADALASCRLDDAMRGAEVPADCYLWYPLLDLDDPVAH